MQSYGQCNPITTLGSPVTQNFNTLSNTAGSTTNNLTITGWYMTETGGGARDNEQYAVDNGASTTGDTYSYGTAAASDRALGQLRSGTLIPNFGACFTNNTGSTIASLDISFFGEQWRLGTTGRTDQLNFEYSNNATDLVTGTWTNVAVLNFVSPFTTTAGALDGNAAANRTSKSTTITGLSIPNGATFWIRWQDTDATGADDGLAIDDFSLTANAAAASPNMSASLRDALLVDVNSNTIANPGDQLRYTNTIRNTSATVDANGVNFNDSVPINTTFNAGSRVTSALARNDTTATSYNTILNTGNLLTNDFGLPAVTVVTFGTTASLGTTTAAGSAGTTDAGGTLTVNTNGTLSYTPPLNFTGIDRFMYIATTGVAGLPNNDAVVVITIAPDITFSTTPVNILCNGASTGSITFTGVGGGSGAGYTYSITGAAGTYQPSNVFSGLPAGTYNPAVKDGAGYIKTAAPIILTEPATFPSFTHVDVNNTCAGATAGSITFTASGGTPGYMYSITGAAGTYQASNVFSGLAAGTYNLAVRDANLCIVTGTATITAPPAITFTTNNVNITCNGGNDGSITFTASGGTGTLTFSITGAAGTYQASNAFTGLTPGTYNPAVRDANNCIVTAAAIALTQPAAIVVSGTVPQLTFNVAMTPVTFTKTGGVGSPANPWSVFAGTLPTNLTLNTATGQLSGTPNQVGLFSVTIRYTDATGCTDDLSITIDVGANLGADTYTNVGNTQLMGGAYTPAPTTPKIDVVSVANNDNSNQTITYAMVGTPSHGNITMNTDGTFIYQPGLGNSTAATFTYSGTSNGTVRNQTVTINFNGMIWYIQGGAAAGTGLSNSPRNSMPSGPIGATGDFIYVMKELAATNPPGFITMLASQKLIGAGATLNVPTVSPILTIAGAAGNTPTLVNTITLANSVTVDGIDMSTTTNNAVSNAGTTVTGVNFTARNVTTSTGAGIALTGTGNNVTMTMTSLTTNGAVNAVNLISTAGTVTINSGAWTGGAGATFNINGGTVSTTYSGNITQATALAPMVNVGGGHTGTVTFNTGSLSATNGTGFQFNNADGTYNFNGTTTMNGGDAGIDLSNGCGGTFNIPAGISITNPTNEVISILNSTASFTYGGGFTKNNNNVSGITISGNTGGTIAINGSGTKTLSTGTGNAVNLTTNTGTTINFSNNNLLLTTTSGTGFNATGGGTISVTGTGNTITSTTGTALNVANTTIGASGLNFLSISANGGSKGISLNTTGTGGLFVTGTGVTAGSGGTIQNITTRGAEFISAGNINLSNMNFTSACTADFPAAPTGLSTGVNTADNAVIHLQTVSTVTLNRIIINGSAEQGINGHNVNSFNLTNSSITNAGNGPDEDGIHFFNMSGTCSITNTTITGSGDDNFILQNNTNLGSISTVGTLNITGGSFTNAVQGSGILFGIRGNFNTTINITGGVTSTNNFSGGIVADAYDNCTMALTVNGCTSSGNNDQLSVSAGDNSNVDLIATGNTLSSVAAGDFVVISLLGSALDNGYTFDATISGNNISVANGLPADGILANNAGGGLLRAAITNNTFTYAGTQRAIAIQQGQDGAAQTNATVTGNNIDVQLDGAGNAVAGIFAQSQVASPTGNGSSLCVDIGGAGALRNIFTHSLGGTMAAGDIRVRQRSLGGAGSSTARMPGYAGGVNTALAAAHLDGRNTVVSASTVTIDDNMSGGAACQQPN